MGEISKRNARSVTCRPTRRRIKHKKNLSIGFSFLSDVYMAGTCASDICFLSSPEGQVIHLIPQVIPECHKSVVTREACIICITVREFLDTECLVDELRPQ